MIRVFFNEYADDTEIAEECKIPAIFRGPLCFVSSPSFANLLGAPTVLIIRPDIISIQECG